MKPLRLIPAVLLALAVAPPAGASHDADSHTANMSLVSSFDDIGRYRDGSDIAIWGDRAVFGNIDPGGFRVVDISDPAKLSLISQFKCNGSQNDVSIWEDLVFVSVDGPRATDACDSPAATTAVTLQGQQWEGIRIVSIADPADPKLLANVRTDCGSHTHTLVPDTANDRVLLYVLSYPLTAHTIDCNAVTHRKISVIEVPLDAPATARVVSTPSVSPAVGCHDVTVFLEQKLAAAACLTESQIWDIADPVNPVVRSHIVNPLINIHHSSAFSWDGDTIVIGDEMGGAAAAAGCLTPGGSLPLGALWFYDVSNPASPALRGWFVIPRQELNVSCTAHNFNVIPLTGGRDVLVTAWYNGGTAVVDFTNPAAPAALGTYAPKAPRVGNAWSSYFYNGHIYVNNLGSRGIDVLRFEDELLAETIPLTRLNAQVQEPPPAVAPAKGGGSGGGDAKVLGKRVLPATGVEGWAAAALALALSALALAGWLRRA